MALSDLLKAHGFERHPFSAWRAEDEERDLVEWFIQPPFYEDILGNLGTARQTMKPTTHLIFGMPGGGKTALRKMVEAALLAKSPSSLIIRYTDFSRVLSSGEPRPSLGVHVDELLRLGPSRTIRSDPRV
jgi:DNA replication protein DnaC